MYFKWIFYALLVIILGVLSIYARVSSLDSNFLKEEYSKIFIKGIVSKIEIIDGNKKTRLILKTPVIEGINSNLSPKYIRMTIRGKYSYRIGDSVYGIGNIMPPSAPIIPNGFDFQRYSFFKEIGGYGYYMIAPEVDIEETVNNSIKDGIYDKRDELEKNVTSYNINGSHLFSVLLTGKKGSMLSDDIDNMRGSGLAHMLAISGMHVGMISGLVFFLIRALLALIPYIALRYNIKNIAAVFAIFTAFSYMYFSGAAIPAQRAAVMVGIVMCAIMLDRSPISMRLVCFCAMIILLIAPESIISASFHLSFSAVIGLVLFWGHFGSGWWSYVSKRGVFSKFIFYFLGIAVTSGIAWMFTAPFVLYHFQNISLVSLPANILAMPILAFIIMPMVLLTYVLLPFGWEVLPIKIGSYGADLVLRISEYFTGFEYSVINYGDFDYLALMLLLCGFLFAYFFIARVKLFAIVPFVCLFLYLYLFSSKINIYSNGNYNLVCLNDKGCFVNEFTGGKFEISSWAKGAGFLYEDVIKITKANDGDIRCDEKACRIYGEKNISVIFSNNVLKEECEWADIIVVNSIADDNSCGNDILILNASKFNPAHIKVNRFSDSVSYVRGIRGDKAWVSDRF